MKKYTKVAAVSGVFALVALGAFLTVGQALAVDDCTSLGGVVASGECQISSAVSASGTFNIAETLHILPAGKITVNAPSLTLNITGDFVVDTPSGAQGTNGINADVLNLVSRPITINASGDVTLHGDGVKGARITSSRTGIGTAGDGGGNITIKSGARNLDGTCAAPPSGDISMEEGADVLANTSKYGAGDIIFNACHEMEINGLVQSKSTQSGAGGVPGGGPITLIASCDLTVGDTGKVQSLGDDPGADLVHVESGCSTVINGIVESSGVGHGAPDNPHNRCDNTNHPDKPSNATACVEIWAGNSLVIDHTSGNVAEVIADTGASPGGAAGTSWIDIFARGGIMILGQTSASPFAVHANGNAGSDNGGIVTVKSRDAGVNASGKAIQASAPSSGGQGGTVTVHAKLDVNLNNNSGEIEAIGSTGGGPNRAGGHVFIKSFGDAPSTGSILTIAPFTVDVTGGPTIPNGTVDLQACGTVGYPPLLVTPASIVPTVTTGSCGGAPTFESYVVLPNCPCQQIPPSPCATKVCDGTTLSVVGDVVIDFNPAVPVCSGDAGFCPFFAPDTSGATPSDWKAVFDLGGKALNLKPGSSITVLPVGAGNNRETPGLVIKSTCNVDIESGSLVNVTSINRQAGNILIKFDGDINIDGEVRNEVKGSNGMPGMITVASVCGNLTESQGGLIQVLGVDPGGNDINLLSCSIGDIETNGLVLSRARAHGGGPRPDINVAAFDGSVTINGNTPEPFFDEYSISGGRYDLWGGLLSWVLSSDQPGKIQVQAAKDIAVNGHGNDPTSPVRKSFGAVAAVTRTSDPHGGIVDVRSIGGNISGDNRAFDVSGRNKVAPNIAQILLKAAQSIGLTRSGATADFNPVSDASAAGSQSKGGTNDFRAFTGGITVNANAAVSAAATGSGSTNGQNQFTACGPIVNNGAVTPASVDTADCSVAAPAPIFASCADFGI